MKMLLLGQTRIVHLQELHRISAEVEKAALAINQELIFKINNLFLSCLKIKARKNEIIMVDDVDISHETIEEVIEIARPLLFEKGQLVIILYRTPQSPSANEGWQKTTQLWVKIENNDLPILKLAVAQDPSQ